MKAIILSLCALSIFHSASAEESCGEVTIADMNWASASFMANVDKMILEFGYGCRAKLVPGDSVPTTTSMTEKAEPDIAPELWINSAKAVLDQSVAEGKLRLVSQSLSDGGEEGFWVPAYLVKKYPDLKTIAGVRARAALFQHPEDPEKSMLMGCPAGWACQITSENLFKALELEKSGFEIVHPGSSAGLSGAIAKAYERNQAWFGYYWAPTAVLGRYNMVKVDLGASVDLEHFQSCITKHDCLNPKVSAFPKSPVWTVVTEKFAKRAPSATAYLEKRAYTNANLNAILAWIEENQADGEYAALHFLKQYGSVWANWVPEKTAQKIRKAL